MPDPREFERLKKQLLSIAGEGELLKERGEPHAPFPVAYAPAPMAFEPEASLSEEAGQGFGPIINFDADPEPVEKGEGEDASYSDVLSGLDLSPSEPDAPSPDQGLADDDISALLGGLGTESGMGDFNPDERSDPGPKNASDTGFDIDGDAGSDLPAFSLDDIDQGSRESQASDQDGSGDMGADMGAAFDSDPLSAPDDGGFDLSAFSMDEPAPEDAAPDEKIEESPGDQSSGDRSALDMDGAEELFSEAGPEAMDDGAGDGAPKANPYEIPAFKMDDDGQDDADAGMATEEPLPGVEGDSAAGDAELSDPGDNTPAFGADFGSGFSIPEEAGGEVANETAFSPDYGDSGQEESNAGFGSEGDFGIPDFSPEPEGGESQEMGAGPQGEEAPSPQDPVGLGASFDLEPGADSFDSFNFGETPSESGGGFDSFDKELAALDEPLKAADTFSLDDGWSQEVSPSESPAEQAKPERRDAKEAKRRKDRDEEGALDDSELSLSEKELDWLQDALLSYPLNLRVEMEKALLDEGLDPAHTNALVRLMVRGGGAEEAAQLLGKFLGKRIKIPKGFEKKTGQALEAEQASFWYAFKKNIVPMAGMTLAAFVGIGVLGFLIYQFIYIPLHADSVYRFGYQCIREEDYAQSINSFNRAYSIKPVRSWHFKYAEAYIEKKQYLLAEDMYEKTLEHFRRDKRAALDYARLESKIMFNYPKAERVLKEWLLSWRPKDADGLLALGDVYLDWSEEIADPTSRLETLDKARLKFASLLRMYGQQDLYLGRMLLYFIRSDKMKEVEPLAEWLLRSAKPKLDSAIYAELGGYLIDHDSLDKVQRLLKLGVKRDPVEPRNHYQLARLFRLTNMPEEELKALHRAVFGYENRPLVARKRIMEYIDSLNWSGDWYKDKRGSQEQGISPNFLAAEGFYVKGIKVYEDALAKRRLSPEARFGNLYADLGDIYYYDNLDYPAAFDKYQTAARNGFDTADTAYKRGFIQYRRGEYRDAVEFFFRAQGRAEQSDNLLYSLANSFYQREDYNAAAAYYKTLVDRLEDQLSRLQNIDLEGRPGQKRLATMLLVAYNNLGVSQYRLSAKRGSSELRAGSMAALASAIGLNDSIARDKVSMERPLEDRANLAFFNLDGILHPKRDYAPIIYTRLPKDLAVIEDANLYDTLIRGD